jgi:hypothetical protein
MLGAFHPSPARTCTLLATTLQSKALGWSTGKAEEVAPVFVARFDLPQLLRLLIAYLQFIEALFRFLGD